MIQHRSSSSLSSRKDCRKKERGKNGTQNIDYPFLFFEAVVHVMCYIVPVWNFPILKHTWKSLTRSRKGGFNSHTITQAANEFPVMVEVQLIFFSSAFCVCVCVCVCVCMRACMDVVIQQTSHWAHDSETKERGAENHSSHWDLNPQPLDPGP